MSTNPHQDPLHYLWHNGKAFSDSRLWFITSIADPDLVLELLSWAPPTEYGVARGVVPSVWSISGLPEFAAGKDRMPFTTAPLQAWWDEYWADMAWRYEGLLSRAPQDLRDLLIDLGLTTTEW